jgi:hypothetical protein
MLPAKSEGSPVPVTSRLRRHDKATLRPLDGLARGKVAKPATELQLRPGTKLV